MKLVSVNPMTGETIREYEKWTHDEVSKVIGHVHDGWLGWRNTSFSERAHLMSALAAKLHDNKEELAHTITLEMGKPINESRAEIDKCAWASDYFAENAETFLHIETLGSDAHKSYVRFDPLGVILAIMPWNFPFWQVFRFAVPAIMAGNAVVLKHASNTMWSALTIEELFLEAGFPESLFRSLLIGSEAIPKIIVDGRIAGVTLTGSLEAGKAVAKIAGEALKKTVLELGGSDPFIVLSDSDIELAAKNAVRSRTLNAGQSCIAAKRFILEKPIASEFLERFQNRMEALVVGDPLSENTDIGPLARMDLRDGLQRQVAESLAMGANLLSGGNALNGPGAFYRPTILTDIKQRMPAYYQELFGPVAAVILAENAEDAMNKANDTDFGLGASIWTGNVSRAEALAGDVDAGSVFINGIVKSDPRLPFGGVKNSGYGRELSAYGIKEFVNIKTVWVGG